MVSGVLGGVEAWWALDARVLGSLTDTAHPPHTGNHDQHTLSRYPSAWKDLTDLPPYRSDICTFTASSRPPSSEPPVTGIPLFFVHGLVGHLLRVLPSIPYS